MLFGHYPETMPVDCVIGRRAFCVVERALQLVAQEGILTPYRFVKIERPILPADPMFR